MLTSGAPGFDRIRPVPRRLHHEAQGAARAGLARSDDADGIPAGAARRRRSRRGRGRARGHRDDGFGNAVANVHAGRRADAIDALDPLVPLAGAAAAPLVGLVGRVPAVQSERGIVGGDVAALGADEPGAAAAAGDRPRGIRGAADARVGAGEPGSGAGDERARSAQLVTPTPHTAHPYPSQPTNRPAGNHTKTTRMG